MKKEINWLFDYPGLKIYQYKEGFKFSLDSILLAEFAQIKKNDEQIIDLCTGNGVIPILLTYKTGKHIVGVEIQKDIYDLAVLSAKYNNFSENVTLICDDVKNIGNYYKNESFDIVLCNPPYFPYHDDEHTNDSELKKIARHEIYVDLKKIIELASYLLKNKGKCYLVQQASRIDEIILYAKENNLAVKEVQFVYSKDGANAKLVLVTLLKQGHLGVKILPYVNINGLKTYQNLFKR